jgi:predicted TIM-barrel fold metal-dependent hydrolase
MIVDVHTRVWDSPEQLGPSFAARIRRSAEGPWELPDASLQAHTAAMEPVHYALVLGAVSRITGAAIAAERVAATVRANPSKNLGIVSIDPLADGYLQTLDEAVEMGMVGVIVSPPNQGFHPTHSRAMRLYRRCVDRKLPVLFDMSCTVPESVMEYAKPYMLDEVLREYPTLPVLIGGLGYPFIEQTQVLINKHEHAYADLAGLTLRPRDLYQVLASAYHTGAITKLMLGSGFPLTTPEKAIVTLYSLNTLITGTNLPSIPREQLRSIVERDALACLGIAYPEGGVQPGQSAASRGGSTKITQTWELDQVKEASRS